MLSLTGGVLLYPWTLLSLDARVPSSEVDRVLNNNEGCNA